MRNNRQTVKTYKKELNGQMSRFPVIFTGHGYPMNAITNNPARSGWRTLAADLNSRFGKPRVIVALTSHWHTDGVCVRSALDNPCLMDVVDLPEIENQVSYEPPASTEFIEKVLKLTGGFEDNSWGVGHALWSPLLNLYPDCDVPVVIVSTNVEGTPEDAYELGRQLSSLRKEGALILASGNIVHEVDMVNHSMKDGYPWADEFDEKIKRLVLKRSLNELFNYKKIEGSSLAVPTPDHYYPLLSAMGAASDSTITVFNNFVERGSLSMTSFIFE